MLIPGTRRLVVLLGGAFEFAFFAQAYVHFHLRHIDFGLGLRRLLAQPARQRTGPARVKTEQQEEK